MTITTPLHPAFLARMQEMLSAQEYTAFLESFNAPRTYGLRVNTSKISCEEFQKLCPFPVKSIPWIPALPDAHITRPASITSRSQVP